MALVPFRGGHGGWAHYAHSAYRYAAPVAQWAWKNRMRLGLLALKGAKAHKGWHVRNKRHTA